MLTPLPSKSHSPTTVDRVHPPALVSSPGGAQRPEEGYVDPRSLLDALGRRWRAMLAMVLVMLTLGMVWTLTRQRRYASISEIVIRQDVSRTSSSSAELPELNKIEEMSSPSLTTQMRLLQSAELISDALIALPPQFRHGGAPQVTVKNTTEDNVVTVTTTAHTPRLAAALTNSLVDTFIKRDLEESRKTASTALAYVQSEMARIGTELHTARQQLAEYETQNNVSGSAGTLDKYTEQLATLNNEAENAATEATVARGTMNSLSAKLNRESREIVTNTTEERNPILDKLDDQIQALEGQRLELLLEFQPDAPEVKHVEEQIHTTQQHRTAYLTTRMTSKTHTVNPIYQQLQQQYLAASTNADAAQIRAGVLQRALADKHATLQKLPAQVMRAAEFNNTVKQLEDAYTLLSSNYQTLRINEASHISNVRVLSRAEENDIPVSPSLPRNMAIALVLGMLLAAGVAVMLEAFDDRVHSQITLEHLSSLPILAYVPRVLDGAPVKLALEAMRNSPVLEGMRLLRSRLYYCAQEMPLGVVAISSAGPQEGKSTIAINLAVALALDGKRVVLVDTDLRRASLSSYFSLRSDTGLTSVVAGQHTLAEAVRETSVARVSVLPSGPLPPNPPEVLNAPQMRRMITELSEQYDMVILDAPPVAGLSDTLVVSSMADGLLLVVSAEQTRKGMFQLSLQTLEQIGAPLLGLVLNRVNPSRHPYMSAYYPYLATPESVLPTQPG